MIIADALVPLLPGVIHRVVFAAVGVSFFFSPSFSSCCVLVSRSALRPSGTFYRAVPAEDRSVIVLCALRRVLFVEYGSIPNAFDVQFCSCEVLHYTVSTLGELRFHALWAKCGFSDRTLFSLPG